jgi:Domain of unknown function (DUF4440)
VKRWIVDAAVIGVAVLCSAMTIGSRRATAVGAPQATAAEADHTFIQALAKGDKAAVSALLDPELLWTDADGKTQNKSEVDEHLVPSTINDVDSKSYSYDQVVTVRTDSGKLHILRVWAKRPAGWRLLVYHEVRQAESAGGGGGTPPPPVKDCVNPCKSVPYTPANDAEAGVIASWQALETAVTAGDSNAWSTHFADEFVVISSGGTDVVTKQGRMEALDKQKAAGTNGAPSGLAPDHTRMFTFGDTVVMTCQAVPHRGKPAHITRVWIKRDGVWKMTISFQTTIQAAAPVATGE